MSRSLVKRGLAWRITATPPMTTKSTPLSVSRLSNSRSRNAGCSNPSSDEFTATPGSGERQHPTLGVHRFDLTHTCGGRQLELLADEALIDASASDGSVQRQLGPGRPEPILECCHRRFCTGTLEPRNRRLADPQPSTELRLRQPRSLSGALQ